MFLWLGRGRPETISCLLPGAITEGRLVEAHELLSLAPVGLTATLRERTVWSPPVPGLEFPAGAGRTHPATTPAERLRQLRALARVSRLGRRRHRADRTEAAHSARRPLRKAKKPIRPPTERELRSPDGALFGFVLATDPEAWLVIEERPGSDRTAWHYAFARMSNRSLTARHRNRPVWNAPRDRDDNNPTKPYCVRWDVGPKR